MKLIHYFNPGHENAVLNRTPSYTPPASMTTLMSELSSLPMWYAEYEDMVFSSDAETLKYREYLMDRGFHLPPILINSSIRQYDGATICMWGITPQAIRVFESINKEYDINLTIPQWNDKFIYLNSREVSHDILKEIKELSSQFDFIDLPVLCSNIQSIGNIVEDKSKSFLAKAPYSSSGRGLLWLPHGEITQVELQILNGMLNKQGLVSVEKVYNKVVDFAMEFMSDGKGNVSFIGYSLFETNNKGAYLANILQSQTRIEEYLKGYVNTDRLADTKKVLSYILTKYYGSDFKGCIGVDMMIVSEEDNYKVHPCVEVNMRYNMGYLAIKLFENFVDTNSSGKYFLDFNKMGQIYYNHLEMIDKYPLVIRDGKVKSGYLSLCPILPDTKYRAYILIEN